ncbi:aromatic acid exporter family protein, partial [Streptococcus pneumoniae]
VLETFMGVFVAIIVNYDIDRIRLFLEKKEK